MNTIIAVAVFTLLGSNANVGAQESRTIADGAILLAPELHADGGWGARLLAPELQADGGWDETEEEELVEEEVEFEEEAEEEITGVREEEVAADVAEFIAELVSVYEAQDTESFERLVYEEYS